jgi:hypothetical protein
MDDPRPPAQLQVATGMDLTVGGEKADEHQRVLRLLGELDRDVLEPPHHRKIRDSRSRRKP